ncbi:MAG: imidazoleglycerol-phosphate dehydratase HisB [Halobacteriota archaeon]|nr:imidazoleglycerol-phosphate dehydratase HisB [Halobacteriota archaeon]
MRRSKSSYKTKETEIKLELDLDGIGDAIIDTGIPFFDHMLSSFATHGLLDLTVKASGDLDVDEHHIIEDVGICLGEALKKALGDKKKIRRFGDAMIPMDESFATCAVDLGGRAYLVFDATFSTHKVGEMSTQLVEHFLHSLVSNANINLNIKIEGTNDHHKIEAMFKALGISIDKATQIDERRGNVPSTKGSL